MTEAENWVRARADCTMAGFLRLLREAVCEDVIEANKHFDPDKSFSLSCADAADLRVNRRLKGEECDDAFVIFRRTNDAAITVSYYYRNGDGRSRFSEQPMGRIALDWNRQSRSCAIKLCGEELSLVALREKTLSKLFFGD